jgi:hypothetical protein
VVRIAILPDARATQEFDFEVNFSVQDDLSVCENNGNEAAVTFAE